MISIVELTFSMPILPIFIIFRICMFFWGEVWREYLKEVGKLGEELQMAGVQSAHPD